MAYFHKPGIHQPTLSVERIDRKLTVMDRKFNLLGADVFKKVDHTSKKTEHNSQNIERNSERIEYNSKKIEQNCKNIAALWREKDDLKGMLENCIEVFLSKAEQKTPAPRQITDLTCPAPAEREALALSQRCITNKVRKPKSQPPRGPHPMMTRSQSKRHNQSS